MKKLLLVTTCLMLSSSEMLHAMPLSYSGGQGRSLSVQGEKKVAPKEVRARFSPQKGTDGGTIARRYLSRGSSGSGAAHVVRVRS